jgi:DNA-binding beta-propeller fold protein YncE
MASSRRISRTAPLLALVALAAGSPDSQAGFAYITGGTSVFQWDTTTNAVTPLFSSATGGSLDSLIFDSTGQRVIYSIIGSNAIGVYNINTHSNTVLSSGGNLSGVADMALDPSGKSFLVSNAFGNSIDRIDITTGQRTTLYSGLRPDGLAYDANGDLFAVLGLNEVAQLDPNTGAVLKTISTPSQPDGLTYDAATGMLYVASDAGGFYTVNTSLTSATFTSINPGVQYDGIANDGGSLYFVHRDTGGVIYNLTTHSITNTSPLISGADDIAPVVGLGSPAATPEPSSIVLLASGIVMMTAAGRRRLTRG